MANRRSGRRGRSPRGQLADFESLACGLFWPRTGYATRGEESSASPPLPPAPALTISREAAQSVQPGDTVALKDPEGVLLGALHVTDTWAENDTWRAAGPVEAITLPVHHDFPQLRLAPWDVRARARSLGWSQWLAFYPGPVLHAGTREALVDASSSLGAGILLLLAPSVAEQDDLSRIAQVRAVEAAARKLPAGRALAVLVPTVFPTEAAHAVATRALVARNFGASVYAIDVTTVAPDVATAAAFAEAASIRLLPFEPWGFSPARAALSAAPREQDPGFERAPSEEQILSGVATGAEIPRWLLTDDELAVLRQVQRSRTHPGFTVFFTGLSGSGKSTLAGALRQRLMEVTGRPVTLLDGDLVRTHLSSELGFSREHRDMNVRRIGWVASEITRHGGIAVCAPIAPYDEVRKQVRAMIEPVGGFILVHVATSLAVCERRDRKGLYARARAGLIPGFTGISDPYEPPDDAALRIDTEAVGVDAACQAIIDWLVSARYLTS